MPTKITAAEGREAVAATIRGIADKNTARLLLRWWQSESATHKALMGAVQDQRSTMLNILSVVQCLKIAARAGGDEVEIEGALDLLEGAVSQVVEGLDPTTLGRTVEASMGAVS